VQQYQLLWRDFPDQVMHIIDAHLQEECEGFIKAMALGESEVYGCVLSTVQVALACTRPAPGERMNMIRKSYVAVIK